MNETGVEQFHVTMFSSKLLHRFPSRPLGQVSPQIFPSAQSHISLESYRALRLDPTPPCFPRSILAGLPPLNKVRFILILRRSRTRARAALGAINLDRIPPEGIRRYDAIWTRNIRKRKRNIGNKSQPRPF